MLAQVYVHCPICFAMIHESNKDGHWYWHKVSMSDMAHGLLVVAIEDEMKKQDVTWPGDLKDGPYEPPRS